MAVSEIRVGEERELVAALGSFLDAFGRAQQAGVDAQAVIALHLREAMGEAWNELPPMVRMLLG